MTGKQYDRAYFDRWYRGEVIGDKARLQRKVALAVSMAEYYLERPIETVLDIGCGEGAWRAPLLALRPDVQYLGFDSSEYAVARYGRTRNIHYARFGDFATLRPCAPADLVICSDVLHYLGARELARGLPGIADLCSGLAFVEVFTRDDATAGDGEEFHARTAAFYRKRLQALGLLDMGNYCWLSPQLGEDVTALEIPA